MVTLLVSLVERMLGTISSVQVPALNMEASHGTHFLIMLLLRTAPYPLVFDIGAI